jgi:LCP family protein required for cell wall assembly
VAVSDIPLDPRSITVERAPEIAEPPRRRRARRIVLIVLAVLLALSTVPAYLAWSAWSGWRSVERVELSDLLQGSASGTNYLIVGTDSREGINADTVNAGLILGEGTAGARTDTIAVLRVDDVGVSLLAIPRDLWVEIPGGKTNRINAAFAFGGGRDLVQTVQNQLGIGLDHYLEIDLAGFLGLVDALGSVTVDFPYPAFDTRSGLNVAQSGPVELDGPTALAYVRSRRYTEHINGEEITDPTSDLGRVQRQQRFLRGLMAELGGTRNPFTLLDALDAVAANVKVDDGLSITEAARLGLRIRGAEPITATVPTTRYITPGGADVLVFTPESEQVLEAFRG